VEVSADSKRDRYKMNEDIYGYSIDVEKVYGKYSYVRQSRNNKPKPN